MLVLAFQCYSRKKGNIFFNGIYRNIFTEKESPDHFKSATVLFIYLFNYFLNDFTGKMTITSK